jgi:hypothetical protein
METVKTKRKELLHFIDKRAFDAVLHLPPETYSGKYRILFEKARRKAKNEQHKLHSCKTPEEIKNFFLLSVLSPDMGNIEDGQEHFEVTIVPEIPALLNEFKKLCDHLEV